MSRRTNRAAFTLVELLVVIGIIALLISILLPSLNKARRAANSAACLSNLRQVMLGTTMYVTDNGGWLPYVTYTPFVEEANNRREWYEALAPYLGYKRDPTVAYDCPPVARGCPDFVKRSDQEPSAYGMNYMMLMPDATAATNQALTGYRWDASIPEPGVRPLKLNAVRNKQGRIMYGDSSWRGLFVANRWFNWPTMRISSPQFPNGTEASGDPERHLAGRLSDGLDGSANYVFADGHASQLSVREASQSIKDPARFN
jgi:prepilin-type N-terminal cleavage/methylation domain-containing protein/prepilin-type processing-associated H-X9-DG protein